MNNRAISSAGETIMEPSVLLCGYSYHAKEAVRGSRKVPLSSYLFRLQTEGACHVYINGEVLRIESGDLIMLKPGSYYELSTDGATGSGDYYMFSEGPWMDEWWSRSDKPVCTRILIGESILYPWRHIIKEKRRLNAENEELTSYLLRVLCLSLERAVTDSHASYSRAYTALRLKQFIEENATRTFRVEEAARHVALSVSRASHFFKECYGKTMLEYALEVRLAGAIDRMKHTSMTMEQIAESCGFGSYTYFHRVFKRKIGLSPTAYRKMDNSFR